MTLERLNTILQVASVVVIGITFLIAAGALWTSYLVNQRQETRIAGIGRDAAGANLKAAQLNERAEQLALENAKLRAAMADRRLSAEQQRVIAEAVRGVAPDDLYAWIRSDRGDSEAAQFADDIVAALTLAGIQTEVRRDGYEGLVRPIEIRCGREEDRAFTVALFTALSTARHSVTPLWEGGCGGTTDILIGRKPAPIPQ